VPSLSLRGEKEKEKKEREERNKREKNGNPATRIQRPELPREVRLDHHSVMKKGRREFRGLTGPSADNGRASIVMRYDADCLHDGEAR